jgi:lauroyl/myristoyl acyltransferase
MTLLFRWLVTITPMGRQKERLRQNLRLTLELFQAGEELMRQNLRRRFPQASEEEIETRLGQWLAHRPGAEHGDGVGRPRSLWPRS